MLYSTKLPITDTTKVNVVYQNQTGADVSLGVAYNEDYSTDQMKYYPLPETTDGWQKAEIDLKEEAGKTAYALSLKVSNSESIQDYVLNLGQLSVYDSTAPILSKPRDAKVTEKLLGTAFDAEARLSWSPNEDALFYEVYQENADRVKTLLGVTPNNHFYTSSITRTIENASKDNTTTLIVVPVNKDYVRGEETELTFDWGMGTDATEFDTNLPSPNVALNAEVTDVSFENAAEPASNVLDGTATGNSKWAATNRESGYMTIDIGEPKTIRRWRVEHAEHGGEAENMNTIDFELLYKNEAGEWISVKRITDNTEAVTDVILEEPITANEFKLQVHDDGTSPWAAIRIYEWQMFESDVLPKTENIKMHFVTAENNKGSHDKVIFEGAKEGQTVRLYSSLEAEETMAEKTVEEDGLVMFEQLDLGSNAGRVYYTVQDTSMGESLRFSTAYVNEDVTGVIRQINNLPDLNELTVADKHTVKNAKIAYNKLHPDLRKQVTNYDRLVQTRERMQELKKNFNNGNGIKN